MTELGANGYLADINSINQNIANFRGEKLRATQEQALANIQAKQENDLDDLRKVGTGISEKSFKDIVSKYGSKLYYNRFAGGGSLKDLDYKLGDKLLGRLPADKALPSGNIRDGGEGVELGDMRSAPRPMTTPEEASRPMLENKLGEGAEDAEHNPADAVEKEGDLGGSAEHDQEDLDRLTDDNLSVEDHQDLLDSKYNFSGGTEEEATEGVDELSGGGADIAESAGAGATEAVGAEEGGAVLEGLGAGLEATGFLAPFGFLLQAIGIGADAYGAYEAGKGVVDAFENDVLGIQTYKNPVVAQPTPPQTLLNTHMLITPTSDTLHQAGSSLATGW